MIERQSLLDGISERLALIKSKVEVSNAVNLTDINVVSENFYRDLLNIVFGYSLKNVNAINQNAAAIDLVDDTEKICFQVTSTSTLAKTRKSVAGFIENKYHEKYTRLIILNISSKSNHQDEFVGEPNVYQLNTKKDIWDVSDLYKVICDCSTDEIRAISAFLKNEIRIELEPTVAKEIRTLLSLIELISDESQPSAGTGYIDAPDPNGKINQRFAEHSNYLKQEYQNLYTEYGQVLADVLAQPDMGHIRIRRLGNHLRNISDTTLTECEGNALKALDTLVGRYSNLLSINGAEFDDGAIRFFLVDQLIKCNVFPNKVEQHA